MATFSGSIDMTIIIVLL